MEVFDQYSALLALGMPPCLPKPRDANAASPEGWHWSGLSDLLPEQAAIELRRWAKRWFDARFGTCAVVRKSDHTELHWMPQQRTEGRRPLGDSGHRRKTIGQHLLSAGLLTPVELEAALRQQHMDKRKLGEVLLDLGSIQPDDLLAVLALQKGLPWVAVADMRTLQPSDKTTLVPERLCRWLTAISVDRDPDVGLVWVAMAEPETAISVDAIRAATGATVQPCLSTAAAITMAIDRCYAAAPLPADSPKGGTDSIVRSPVVARGESTLDAIIAAARVLSGDPDEGTAIHAAIMA